jgi:xanthine dehydrogenase accessory factor
MSAEGTPEVSAADAAVRALEAQGGGDPVALVTVVDAPDVDAVGRRLVVTGAATAGTLGSKAIDSLAADLARRALKERGRSLQELEVESGVWRLYIETHYGTPELVIVGAGHIARPLHRLGAMLGFRVTVIDDRPEYANREWFPEAERVQVIDFNDPFEDIRVAPDTYIVLVTRGHKYDYDCIQKLLLLESRPAYLGMIGSRRRVRAAFEALLADGIAAERLADVRAPIGLDLGAETPEEIALAIASEIVAQRRGASGGSLSDSELVLERAVRKNTGGPGGE